MLEPVPLELRRLRELLRQAGFGQVLAASDGDELLMLLSGEPVQLVLVPWGVPGFSGPELLRMLRGREHNRNVPVVILDDGLPQQAVVSAIKAGVAGRLRRPASVEQLKEVLAALPGAEAPPA